MWGLGNRPLANWDEAIYAQISKEILQSGDWFTLHWESQLWFEKPPLYIWITAILFHLFGVSEFWARAASALSGAGLLAFTYLIGKFISSEWVGLLAALILLTSFQFAQSSRLATTDMMMLMFIYSAIYFYLRLRDGNQRWWYLISISCALAFMVKGFASFVAPAAIALALPLDKRFTATIRSRHFWLSCLFALALIAPWHIGMYLLHGNDFIDEYVRYHVITRTLTPIEGHTEDYWFYFRQVIEKFKPWWILTPLAIAFHARENIKGRSSSWILLVVGILVFGVYTVAQTKLPWYIAPLYPALTILIASMIVRAYKLNRTVKPCVILLCAISLLFAASKLRPLYYETDTLDTPVKKLALLARRTDANDLEPLILFSKDCTFDRHAVLFYSERRILQATLSNQIDDKLPRQRYADYKDLAEVTNSSTQKILLNKRDIETLLADYEINVVAEADFLAYATIKKREKSLH